MKKTVIIFFIVIVLGVFNFFSLYKYFLGITEKEDNQSWSFQKINNEQETNSTFNIRAGFVIFTRNLKRSFSNPMYHNLSNEVFITADNPNIVYVKKEGITWNDFFKTLPQPFKLTSECLTTGTGQQSCTGSEGEVKFYLNGERNNDLLNQQIQDGDRVLISYGSEGKDQIQEQINQVVIP